MLMSFGYCAIGITLGLVSAWLAGEEDWSTAPSWIALAVYALCWPMIIIMIIHHRFWKD